MPIHRVPKTKGFAQILNAFFEDPRISWEAKGVGGYLLTKPDTWEPRNRDVIRHGPAGEAKVRRIFKELERNGYQFREKIRLPNGRFAWHTHMFEVPGLIPPRPRSKTGKQPGNRALPNGRGEWGADSDPTGDSD